jgi:hypothetical protein
LSTTLTRWIVSLPDCSMAVVPAEGPL